MTSANLMAQLNQAAAGLLFPSESDYPLVPFVWSRQEVGAPASADPATPPLPPEALLGFKGYPPNTPVQVTTPDAFFAPVVEGYDPNDPEQQQAAGRHARLVQVLQENLANLTVYRVGKRRIDVFVVGTTAEGDFAGVSTTVVET